MTRARREIVKRLRFNADQAAQLESYLALQCIGFTQLVHALLKHELNKYWMNVTNFNDQVMFESSVILPAQKLKPRNNSNLAGRPAPKIDPELLRALGHIGNNVNQIARSLNYLCLQHTEKIQLFSFIDCIDILEHIQYELHKYLPSLPIYKVTEEQSQRRKARAIALAEKKGR
jgi:hypothetical protein